MLKRSRLLAAFGLAALSADVLAADVLAAEGSPPASSPVCRRSDAALVVSRERKEDVGEDIYVRVPPGAPDAPCAYASKSGDWVLGKGAAFAVLVLEGSLLAIDSGTGAKRRLLIYDVSTRKKRVDVDYDDRKEKFAAGADGIDYWRIAAKPVKPAACSAAWRADNKDAKQAHRTFQAHLAPGADKPRDTGATDCVLTEDDL